MKQLLLDVFCATVVVLLVLAVCTLWTEHAFERGVAAGQYECEYGAST
jgi:hypothetical protein